MPVHKNQFKFEKKKNGRNQNCDHDWIKVQKQREKRNKSPIEKGLIKVQIKKEIEVQREKGNKSWGLFRHEIVLYFCQFVKFVWDCLFFSQNDLIGY